MLCSYCNRTHSVRGDARLAQRIEDTLPELFQDNVMCAGYEVEVKKMLVVFLKNDFFNIIRTAALAVAKAILAGLSFTLPPTDSPGCPATCRYAERKMNAKPRN